MREYIHKTELVTLCGNSQLKFGELNWDLRDLSGKPVPAGIYKVLVSLLDWKLSGEISIEITDI
jgi:hypothetical protein